MSGVSQESVLGLVLFISFVGDMDREIKCTDDAKLCGVVGILEGRDTI